MTSVIKEYHVEFTYEKERIKMRLDEHHESLLRWASSDKKLTFREEPMLRYLKDQQIIGPGSTVVEVGAYIGNHVIFYSKIVGVRAVIAFEPTLRSFGILKENIEKNELDNVLTYNYAVANMIGLSKCNIRKENNPAKNQWFLTKETDGDCIPTVTLDSEVGDVTVDFIKIDAEGMEIEVLKGGEETIKRDSPTLMVEILKENLEEFERLMADWDYQMIDAKPFPLNRTKKANTLLYMRNK